MNDLTHMEAQGFQKKPIVKAKCELEHKVAIHC